MLVYWRKAQKKPRHVIFAWGLLCGMELLSGSSDRIRTYNLAVNSRPLYR